MGVFQASLPAVALAACAASVCARDLMSTPPPPPPGDSIAKCSVSLSSSGFAQGAVAVAAAASAEVALAICDTGSAEFAVSEEATATALAAYAAEAIAKASVDCYTSGQTSIKINGKSAATAAAEVFAKAFASATASASVCNKCSAEAKVVAEVVEREIIKAVAVAEININAVNNPTPRILIEIISRDIKSGILKATALAIADARASALRGCQVEVLIDGAAGDSRNPSTFFCNVQSNALDLSFKQDAIAKAAATAAVSAGCYEDKTATATAAAKELAVAAAIVFSEVIVACDVVGKGGACALGANDINATVTATATAFAQAFANATSTCKKNLCDIDLDAFTESISTVLSTAAAATQADVCLNGTNSVDIEVFELDSNVSTITALANVIVSASVEGGVCNITVADLSTSTKIETTASNSQGVTVIVNGVPVQSGVVVTHSPKPPAPPPPPTVCSGACVPHLGLCAGPRNMFPLGAQACCSGVCKLSGGTFGYCRTDTGPGAVIPCGTY